jgi:hypothetical protein
MKFILKNVNSIFAFLVGVFAVFYFKGCEPKPKPEVIRIEGKRYEVIKRDTVYQKKTITKYRDGVYVYHADSVYVEIPANVDTSKILEKYYQMNVFVDSLETGYGPVIVKDTIQLNKIKGRSYTGYLKIPEVRTTVKQSLTPALFAGLGSGINGKGRIQEVSAHLFLETRKRTIYGIGVGVAAGAPVYKLNILLKL